MNKRPKKPDFNQLAKFIVDEATDETPHEDIDEKKKAAIESGRLGGLKGGKARSEKLTPEERSRIAKKAANARWNGEKQDNQNQT